MGCVRFHDKKNCTPPPPPARTVTFIPLTACPPVGLSACPPPCPSQCAASACLIFSRRQGEKRLREAEPAHGSADGALLHVRKHPVIPLVARPLRYPQARCTQAEYGSITMIVPACLQQGRLRLHHGNRNIHMIFGLLTR